MRAEHRRQRWAAYATCVLTGAYGLMKLAHALGSDVLVDKEPMRPDLRVQMLARDGWFVASYWIMAAVAIAGVLLALATVQPWGRRLPRRLLLGLTGGIGALMVLRSVGPVGFGFLGDALVLTGLRPPPAEHAELARHLARWDLMLWSPFFLAWGALWIATARQFARRTRTSRIDT
ncbi:hypothetical protein GCM10009678_68710 [Actinomadura kijaniata]|uniref:DUF3995 domain-containing protein n=1 Tax=Actinomadura namibiensis TaxID=182080 RepID=A0A7W3QRY1_ACTNM|nr:DUF3995 domain-containing protein [Actinomadura namibiensis]MBA8956833.1 hypothetical protein [Actinomadura namibiensis]